MRERTTWNRDEIQKQASNMSKRAEDPTAMNQDHIQRQPSADKYLTGDPSTFAEDVHPSGKNWKAEYSDGQTSRNEIGLPEMRDDTFNHPETDPGSSPARGSGGGGDKQAALDEETLVKKADLCCKVARRMLGSKAVEAAIEDQALALMGLSDSDLISTVNRMAQDQDQQDQGEQKQAKDLPPEFLENIQKKKDEAKDKKEAQDQGQEQEQEQKQAGQMPDFIKKKIEEKEEKEDKEASSRKQATLDQMAQQLQTLAQQIQQMQQGQQQEQQVQQAPAPQMQEQQALDAMLQEQSNDQMIDQMLQQGQGQSAQMANEMDIQMDSPQMDIGEAQMGPEDDVLSTLFANNSEVQNAQQAYQLQHGTPAPMQAQASSMIRTAATRTVGTRPTGGVTKLGGLGSPAPTSGSGGDVEKLSNLWNSAPDVSDVFRS
jgi:hypothetical protein